jgi:thiamine-monophosphate kinase
MSEQAEKNPVSESELVEMFERMFASGSMPIDLLIGIGDDAAAFEPGVDPESKFVITADMLVQDIHFVLGKHSYYNIGYRCAAANLSDIAAMGAIPRWAVCTLATPRNTSSANIEEIARGLSDCLSKFDTRLIGGDLTRSPGPISISMTVIGETTGRLVRRTGAVLGDVIAVTGYIGDRSAGLAMLMSGMEPDSDYANYLIDQHLKPEPRILAGQFFAGMDGIHSMMDISDGVGIDLFRMANASGTGFRIFEEKFPVSPELGKAASALGRDIIDFTTGGEDFELLIAGTEEAVNFAIETFASDIDLPSLTIIGDMLDKPLGMHMLRSDGNVVNPSDLGWDHFKQDVPPEREIIELRELEISSQSENDTIKLGEKIGKSLRGGEFILLVGPLGSGKSTLTRGIAKGLGIAGPVRSPSFNLMREYKGKPGLRHWDLFRLDGGFAELGIYESTDENTVTVIEWADRWDDLERNCDSVIFMDLGEIENERTIRIAGNLNI